MTRTLDIFCKIVDNFGDIGVCWRLARQLQHEHDFIVTLWVDDWVVAKRMMPLLDLQLQKQAIDGVAVAYWCKDTQFEHMADVVVEGFGCGLPQAYLDCMTGATVWINLEYLSAESWVDGFHGKSSNFGALQRHFFFPGFTPATGGLIRESTAMSHDANANQQLEALLTPAFDGLKVSLFCYPHAPISDLLTAFLASHQAVTCYVPESSILSEISAFFGKGSLKIGDVVLKSQFKLQVLPFLSQPQYDQLLRVCDINFVRGEDSWIRAIWAGKPFIWQPYLQSEATHIEKLDAFLNLYFSQSKAACTLHHAWVSQELLPEEWEGFLHDLPQIRRLAQQQHDALVSQADLATNLVIFIEKLKNNHV